MKPNNIVAILEICMAVTLLGGCLLLLVWLLACARVAGGDDASLDSRTVAAGEWLEAERTLTALLARARFN